MPAEFSDSFEEYTNSFCWIHGTYYVEEGHEIPDDISERNKAMIKYYQWIYLIMLLQGAFFLVPRIIWLVKFWKEFWLKK